MTDVSELRQLRGVIKAKITRIETFVNAFRADNEIFALECRKPSLNSFFKEFEDCQTKIELADKQELKSNERENVETQFYNILAKINFFIEAAKTKNSIVNAPSTSSVNGSGGKPDENNIKLPVINLPTFSGAYADWKTFFDTYDSLIHQNQQLNNCQKFHYLKACLKGDALACVESLSISEDNYEAAYELLEKRFNNKRLIAQEHVLAIMNSPIITKTNNIALRKLLNDVNTHLAALKVQGLPINHWDGIIVPVLAEKLDYASRREWQVTLSHEIPKLSEFISFLERRCEILDSMQSINQSKSNSYDVNKSNAHSKFQPNNPNVNKTRSMVHTLTNSKFDCTYCKSKTHNIIKCPEFLNLSPQQRFNYIQKTRACENCLRINHSINNCKSQYTCKDCHAKHNTLIHIDSAESASHNLTLPVSNPISYNLQSLVLLATAIVKVKDNMGEFFDCRILLDSGSQSCLIKESLCKKLNLTENNIKIPLHGVNGLKTAISKCTSVNLRSKVDNYEITAQCLILSEISTNYPPQSFNINDFKFPKGVELADAQFNISSDIDILIGAEYFWDILGNKFITLGNTQHTLVLRQTALGWIVTGKVLYPSRKTFVGSMVKPIDNTSINAQICKFWEMEDTAFNSTSNLSFEERAAETHFMKTYKRDNNGRFIVRLPFKDGENKLGFSQNKALKTFYSLENKLKRDSHLNTEYCKFMDEYLKLKHMELITEAPTNENTDQYFLPHHCVIKPTSTTTKHRVVFNASSKTSNNKSLNDLLMVGPTIQKDLLSILINFRMHQIAFCCDLVKMYRQILLDCRDTKFHRIFWRENCNTPPKVYELKTLTYGTAPASYIATKCLEQLANDTRDTYPLAYPVILNSMYMDDCLTDGDNPNQVAQIINQLMAALKTGGFECQKWASNNPDVLPKSNNQIDKNHLIKLHTSDNDEIKTLGLLWNCKEDLFKFTISKQELICTKRGILSTVAKIFDIMGLIAPVIVVAKILIQKTWTLKLDWDEELPDHITKQWHKFVNQLESLNNLNIPRRAVAQSNYPPNFEIHGFADASTAAYGACLYIRTFHTGNNTYIVQLLCARSRVAPLKTITLPRLELCAAVLLARLITKIKTCFPIKDNSIFLWTDSTIALSWISAPPNRWSVFVANRVAEIHASTNGANWGHVISKDNPADLVSRGVLPEKFLNEKLWFHGPEWLKQDIATWPKSEFLPANGNLISLERRTHIKTSETSTFNIIIKTELPIFLKFSSFEKTRRIIAFCFRFINNCSNKQNKEIGPLKIRELSKANDSIIKHIQRVEFGQEIERLEQQKPLPNSSKLISLNPFLDSQGLLRVGGRLKHASMAYDKKFQIILPSKHLITERIIQYYHILSLHGGPSATLYNLREKYWPIAGRSMTRHILRKCYNCFKVNPVETTQIMSDLPRERVQPPRSFSHSGIDYAGPILIKDGGPRSKRTIKAYIVLFKCFATRAIHIELVTSCTAENFISALKRFMARRGKVAFLYSDNATYFVAANKELNKFLKSSNFDYVIEFLSENNITWKYIPAKSPHRGGYWEAGIKSIKYHLKRVVGNACLTYEELYSVLVRIEACINSRPISILSHNPDDLSPLTPGHFLIGDSLMTTPEIDWTNTNDNRLSRWQRTQKLTQQFWKRWSQEYLHTLQQRKKWRQTAKSTIQVGDLCLLKEDNLHPLHWKTGVVTETHPGRDGFIRTVTVRTSTGHVVRAINRVCPFPEDPKNQDGPSNI